MLPQTWRAGNRNSSRRHRPERIGNCFLATHSHRGADSVGWFGVPGTGSASEHR